MKNPLSHSLLVSSCVPSLAFFALQNTARADLSWDPDLGGSPPVSGTWDTTTANWWDGAANQLWDNSGAEDAIFGSGSYTATIADSGVTLGNLTYGGGGTLQFTATTDNVGGFTIKSGGATWDTGGGEIEFNNVPGINKDVLLNVGSGDTLTVTGGGTFDAGEALNGSPQWSAAGATLDVTSATAVRGDVNTTGKFSNVNLAGGSAFTYGRNSNGNTFANNWELGAGEVTFDSNFNRIYNLDGVISGAGRLVAADNNNSVIRIRNTTNTFTGGLTINSGGRVFLDGGDATLGATAGGTFDADNIILNDGGFLEMRASNNLNSNRGITLQGTGGQLGVVATGAITINGAITGVGGLTIDEPNDSITLAGSGSNYTGVTALSRGTVIAGATNAIGSSVLVIGSGSGSTAEFELNGFATQAGGLSSVGSNTRQISNTGADTTLTVDVAGSESYSYSSNFIGSGAIAIVKEGTGTQNFSRGAGFSVAPTSITVNEGTLNWSIGGSGASGGLTVGANGIVVGNGIFNGASTVSGALSISASSGTGTGTMSFNDSLDFDSTSVLTLDITSVSLFDVLMNDGGDTLTADGVLAFDSTGYSALLGESFEVLANWGGFAGSFSSITGTDLGGGLSLDTSTLLSNGMVTVVPEPSVAWLGGIGFLLVLRRRRI